MHPVESKAGMSVGYRAEDGPSVFCCADFERECCSHCHANNYVIAVYPWSVYSRGKDRMPDLSLGLRAEICCSLFHYVRDLSREWWIRKYAEKRKWSEKDATRLAQATPENYCRIWNEIASAHYEGPRQPRSAPQAPSAARKASRSQAGTCPGCGAKWDNVVCNQCGHAG